MRKKRKTRVEPPRKRENHILDIVHDDVNELLWLITDSDASEKDKNDISRGVAKLEDVIEVLMDYTDIRKDAKLNYPWKNKCLN